MIEMAYSTSTPAASSDRYGWDMFDRMVLWAVAQRASSFDDLVRLVPAGVHYRLVRGSLRVLADAGLVARHRIRGVYEVTTPGLAMLQPDTARKAA
jgi:DNA-binding HxlR family transcriptional regulator